VTSPPYWGLRDYGTAQWEGGDAGCDHLRPPLGGDGKTSGLNAKFAGDGTFDGKQHPRLQQYGTDCGKCGARRIDSQLGLERTPEEYVAKMVEVFREVRRVLRKDGTLWLNLGDSYAGFKDDPIIKPKDLVGIPWRVAFALQADGWYLRSDVIWAKPNPMPESVTDRPTKSHEYLFLLSKSPKYYFDQEAVREDSIYPSDDRKFRASPDQKRFPTESVAGIRSGSQTYPVRNIRTVWTIATQPFPEAHFATFPEKLVEPCIKAGTSEKGCCATCGAGWRRVMGEAKRTIPAGAWVDHSRDAIVGSSRNSLGGQKEWDAFESAPTIGWQSCRCDLKAAPVPCLVLDPFAGSGTVGVVALRLGRSFVGIELKPEYCEMARRRIYDDAPLLNSEAAL